MIDTHAHIDDEQYASDLEAYVGLQQQSGVERIIVPGVNLSSVVSVLSVCERYPQYLFPALGLHPEDVKADWQQQLNGVLSSVRKYQSRLVAIGEIGLDYHWDRTFCQEQMEVFRRQLVCAIDIDLPVIIHNREATEDILHILREVQIEHHGRLRGVFHCFNGSRETAQILLDMGFYLGIGGVLTFKNCHLRDTLCSIPLDRLVLETDSPYLAPVPHRGERNESRYMQFVVQMLADIYCQDISVVEAQTTSNALHLFWGK